MMAGLRQVLQAVIQTYLDTWSTIRALWRLAAMAYLITVVVGVVEITFGLGVTSDDPKTILLRFLLSSVYQALLVPYLIAGQRFNILGETSRSYRFSPGTQRFLRYFWLAVALDWLSSLYSLVAPPILAMVTGWQMSGTALWVLDWIGYIGYIAVTVRLMVLFPAIALDVTGEPLRRAFADAGAYFWRTLAIVIAALFPLLTIWSLARELIATPTVAAFAAAVLGDSVFRLVVMTVGVVVATYLYRRVENRTPRS